jgi:hypothetical protein
MAPSEVIWTPEELISTVDSPVKLEPTIQVDRQGTAWALWEGKIDDADSWLTLYWSRYNGNTWIPPQIVNPADSLGVFHPSFVFDEADTAWVVWARADKDQIWALKGYEGDWGAASPVSVVRGSFRSFAPRIGAGGGRAWVSWWGAAGDSAYNVLVSSWEGSGWTPPFQMTHSVTHRQWFTDIAVDSTRRPHLVWTDDGLHVILYSTLYESGWTSPVSLNDPGKILAANWAAPKIVLAADDSPRVVWVGQEVLSGGALSPQNIYFSAPAAELWSAPVRVNQQSVGWAYYPSLAMSRHGTAWVAWELAGGGVDSLAIDTIAAAEFDGIQSISETRLDKGTFYFNVLVTLAVSPSDQTWASWSGTSQGYERNAILGARTQPTTDVKLSGFEFHVTERDVELAWTAIDGRFVAFEVSRSRIEGGEYRRLGGVPAIPGRETYSWREMIPGPGAYWYRMTGVAAGGVKDASLGPLRIDFGTGPGLLTVSVPSPVRRREIHVQVALPDAATVRFLIYDMQGRVVGGPWDRTLAAGWQNIDLDILDGMGPRRGRGLYVLNARTGPHTASAKFLWLP